MLEKWLDETNEYIEQVDEELLKIRQDAYDAETAKIDTSGMSTYDKEIARHEEKRILKNITKSIVRLRLDLATFYFRQRIFTMIMFVLVVALAFVLLLVGAFQPALVALLGGVLGVSFIRWSSIAMSKEAANMLGKEFANCGQCEARIKAYDFRGLENIDVDRPLVSTRYRKEDFMES